MMEFPAVFCYGRVVPMMMVMTMMMMTTTMTTVISDPGLNGTSCLFSVNYPALAGGDIQVSCLLGCVTLYYISKTKIPLNSGKR
jgi:hypothetical protein